MNSFTRRSFCIGSGAAVAAMASSGGAAAPAASFDPTPYVHPELRTYFSQIKKMFGDTPFTAQALAGERKRSFARPPLPAPAWMEKVIPGPKGAPDVRIYIVNGPPAGDHPRPAILHVHGGGYVLGDAKSSISQLQEIAAALDCVIVTVDYRLAPETRFPGSLEDNYAGLKWLYANAASLGADRSRIAVMGESAGGGHAAMLAIAARDRGEIPLVYQALIYPMLDDRTGSIRKKPPYQGMIIWNEQRNRFGWTSLLGVPAGSRRVPYGSVPARVENLRGLPPAFIGVGSIDLFVDEDIEYAQRLVDAGVSVTLDVVPGAFHGFDIFANTSIARRFKSELIASLKSAFASNA